MISTAEWVSDCSNYRKGANLDAVDASNNTAVDLAVAKQNADCVTLLRLAQLCAEEAKGAGPRGGKGSLHCSQETFLQALMVRIF